MLVGTAPLKSKKTEKAFATYVKNPPSRATEIIPDLF